MSRCQRGPLVSRPPPLMQGRHTHFLARMGWQGDRGPAVVYGLMLFVFPVLRTLVEQAYFYRVQKVNMSARCDRLHTPTQSAPGLINTASCLRLCVRLRAAFLDARPSIASLPLPVRQR